MKKYRLGARIEAKKPLWEARKAARVAKSGMKWKMREALGKVSVTK